MLLPIFKIQGATMKSVFTEKKAGGTPADSKQIRSSMHYTKRTRLSLRNAGKKKKKEREDQNTKKTPVTGSNLPIKIKTSL